MHAGAVTPNDADADAVSAAFAPCVTVDEIVKSWLGAVDGDVTVSVLSANVPAASEGFGFESVEENPVGTDDVNA